MAARTVSQDRLNMLSSVEVEGYTQVEAPVVKAWGAENGFTVPAAQGRLSNALIDGFHTAEELSRRKTKRQYIVGTKTRGAGQEFTYDRADGKGTATFVALPDTVRDAAERLGVEVRPTGRLPRALVNAFGQEQEAARAATRKPRKPRAPKAQEAAPEGTEGE